jgi:hypothetical protein
MAGQRVAVQSGDLLEGGSGRSVVVDEVVRGQPHGGQVDRGGPGRQETGAHLEQPVADGSPVELATVMRLVGVQQMELAG